MIPLQRVPAPARTQGLLDHWTGRVKRDGATPAAAREQWSKATAPKAHVKSLLEQMARGVVRCMYCDDSRGTDIDHFEPLAVAPLRTFAWLNHLLACSFCNSNSKRDQYPRDSTGSRLLVDPTADDPAEHLVLLLRSGEYDALTPMGAETIRVFGLNRSDLVKGRQDAFFRACSIMRDWRNLQQEQDPSAKLVADALLASPFIAVVHAMTRLDPVVAGAVVGDKTVPALRAWSREHKM